MWHKPARLAAAGSMLALLAACAGGLPLHESPQEVRDRYDAYAGASIDSFTWLGRFDGWEPVGKEELVVFTGINEAYLLKVWAPCDMRFVNRVALTSTGGTVYARTDAVKAGQWRCPIEQIRKIDYKRMRADMRLEAQKAKTAQ